jgi:hypothetical protein
MPGNADALAEWYENNPDIDWGAPGDFDRCVAIAGQYMDSPEGYCQLRHIAATGETTSEHAKADKTISLDAPLDSGVVPFDLAGQTPAKCQCGLTLDENGLCPLHGAVTPPSKRQQADDMLKAVEAELLKRGIDPFDPMLTKVDPTHEPAGSPTGGQFAPTGTSSAPTSSGGTGGNVGQDQYGSPAKPAAAPAKPAPPAAKPAAAPAKPAAASAKPLTPKQKAAADKKAAAKAVAAAKAAAKAAAAAAKKEAAAKASAEKKAAAAAKAAAKKAAAAAKAAAKKAAADAKAAAKTPKTPKTPPYKLPPKGATAKKPRGVDARLLASSRKVTDPSED